MSPPSDSKQGKSERRLGQGGAQRGEDGRDDDAQLQRVHLDAAAPLVAAQANVYAVGRRPGEGEQKDPRRDERVVIPP